MGLLSQGEPEEKDCLWTAVRACVGSLVIPERRCALKEESIPFPAILPSFLGNLLLQTDGKYYPVSLLCGACCSGDGICSKAQPTRLVGQRDTCYWIEVCYSAATWD
nr:PREDICTED: uncharacterized protein LOC102350285 isoform X2 [Latimeria chalumnae]|eukprot:XP_014349474.1 PREDICTED: uncharacterized protein LOC102350285 isoform X2 [Latimeria chalumnae]